MSAYSHISEVKFNSLECLKEALAEIYGEEAAAIIYTEEAQHLMGYQGDTRPEVANIIIPGSGRAKRKGTPNLVGSASNDIGFHLQADGSYKLMISEYDSRKHGVDWVNNLKKLAATALIKKNAKKNGYTIKKVTNQAGNTEFILAKIV